MKRTTRAKLKRLSRRRQDESARRPLDAVGRDTVKHFTRTLMEAGYSAADLVIEFESSVAGAPRLKRPRTGTTEREFHDTSHVIRLWVSDPDCVDADGQPRALPVLGPAPSVESLVRRARPDLPLEEALALFFRTHSLRPVGRKLIPSENAHETLIHAPGSEDQSTHYILVLNQLLRNFAFNSKPRSRMQRWPQRVAECAEFPINEVPALISRFAEAAKEFTKEWDNRMARLARRADPAVRRKRTAVNLFLSVGPASSVSKKSKTDSKPR